MSALSSMQALQAKLRAKKEAEMAAAAAAGGAAGGTNVAAASARPTPAMSGASAMSAPARPAAAIPAPQSAPPATATARSSSALASSTRPPSTSSTVSPAPAGAVRSASAGGAGASTTSGPKIAPPRSLAGPRSLARPRPSIPGTAGTSTSAYSGGAMPRAESISRPIVTGAASAMSSSIVLDPLPSAKPATSTFHSRARPATTRPTPAPEPTTSTTIRTPADKNPLKRKKTSAPTNTLPNVNWNPNAALDDPASKRAKGGVSLADTSHLTKFNSRTGGDRLGTNANRYHDETSTIWVENIADDATARDLKAIFSIYGDVTECVVQPPPPAGQLSLPRCGTVRFRARDAAAIALELLNGTIVGGSEVVLAWHDPSRQTLSKDPPKTRDLDEQTLGLLHLPEPPRRTTDEHHVLRTPPRRRNAFLSLLHQYKPHLATQARALGEHRPTEAEKRCWTFTTLACAPSGSIDDGDQPESSAADQNDNAANNVAAPDTQLPPRELVPYDEHTY